jgi:hypothetical protein
MPQIVSNFLGHVQNKSGLSNKIGKIRHTMKWRTLQQYIFHLDKNSCER